MDFREIRTYGLGLKNVCLWLRVLANQSLVPGEIYVKFQENWKFHNNYPSSWFILHWFRNLWDQSIVHWTKINLPCLVERVSVLQLQPCQDLPITQSPSPRNLTSINKWLVIRSIIFGTIDRPRRHVCPVSVLVLTIITHTNDGLSISHDDLAAFLVGIQWHAHQVHALGEHEEAIAWLWARYFWNTKKSKWFLNHIATSHWYLSVFRPNC